MDEELREAAFRGNVEFLKKCVELNKPNEYYLTVFPKRYDLDTWHGNMFHIVIHAEQEEFVRQVIEGDLLPMEVVHQLLCQPRSETQNYNPLHLAAWVGNVEMLKRLLNAFKKSSSSSSLASHLPKPWLQLDEQGATPCHSALYNEKEECALEIWKMDKELLSNMLDNDGDSLLCYAVQKGLNKVAMEILSSPHSFSSDGKNGYHALHFVPNCLEGEKDICRLLLKRVPDLIMRKSVQGLSIFHKWALKGKLWPFECLLNSNDIIPDVRKTFSDLIFTTDKYGANPLHYLPVLKDTKNEDSVEIGKFLIDTYKQDALSSSISTRELQFPWSMSNEFGETPLDLAICYGNEEFALMILSEDKNALEKCQSDVLFKAMEKRFDKAPQKILQIVDEKVWTHLLINNRKQSALHLAPKCNNKEFFEQLLKGHPELLKDDKDGNSILHSWVRIGQVWPFEYLFKSVEFDRKGRKRFVEFISYVDFNGKNNPLHIAATCTHEATNQIVKLLVEAFQEHYPIWISYAKSTLPWWSKNINDEGPLHLALRCQRDQKVASYLLSLNQDGSMHDLLNYYAPKKHEILFLAIKKNLVDEVKMILTRLNKASWTEYLKDFSNGQNVLHLASTCTGKELGRWLVEEAPEFITEPDISTITPLEVASNAGAAWIIEAMLQKDPSSAFNKVPLAWVGACEKGYVSVIRIFIENCPQKFSDHCIHHQDSPLHHIKLGNLMGYEEFLKVPYMKDLINVQDSNKATPLHKAIRSGNILLAEALLNMDNIKYNIKDDEGNTARDLLAQLCKDKQQPQWDRMCKSIGFDPNITTSYFQHKTNLLEVRNTLSVVAALLATITFTAGFTVPGGFDQNTGEAMLADKAAFLVFLISDTLAMCLSMLVLMFLIWSMVFEPNQSLALIDRSVGLIRAALYFTLLAFVTGVYIVILPKALWAAILVIVICSLFGILTANRRLMYGVFITCVEKLISLVKNKESRDPIPLMEEGISLVSHHEENSNQDAPLTSQGNDNLGNGRA